MQKNDLMVESLKFAVAVVKLRDPSPNPIYGNAGTCASRIYDRISGHVGMNHFLTKTRNVRPRSSSELVRRSFVQKLFLYF